MVIIFNYLLINFQIGLQNPQKKFTFSRHDKMGLEQLKEKSPALAEFCSDVTTYRLNVIGGKWIYYIGCILIVIKNKHTN